MNFQGNEAISRSTRGTGRTLLLLSFLLGLAGLGWVKITDNTLVGLTVQQDKFVPLLQWLCVLAGIAHSVQWYSDYISYRGWNITGKLPGVSRWDSSYKTKLQDLVDSTSALPDEEQDLQKLSSAVEKVSSEFDKLRWDMKSFDCFAKFYVFGWYLALPLASACAAFFLSRDA